MTDIVGRRRILQQEEVRSNAAVSESTMSRFGAMANFLALYECSQHDFNLNGSYNILETPFQFGDGFITYPFPFEIVDVILFSGELNGSGGSTEVDIKWRSESGPTFESIFTTKPKFTNAVTPNDFTRVDGPTKTGFTKPVINKKLFNAYDILMLSVETAVEGMARGVFVKVFIRPTSD